MSEASDLIESLKTANEITRLRAALDAQKAEQKYLMGLAAADAETLRAALAEAERERDIAQMLYETEKNVCSEWIASARCVEADLAAARKEVLEQAASMVTAKAYIVQCEADLAAARDVIESYYASGFCPECLMGQPCQPNCTLSKTSAFLERD